MIPPLVVVHLTVAFLSRSSICGAVSATVKVLDFRLAVRILAV